MVSTEDSDTLAATYFDVTKPASYGTATTLSKATGIPLGVTRSWLQGQDAYTLHKPIRKRFSRNKYVAFNIDDYWEADLVDMSSKAGYNDSVKFLLVVIDVFSKFVFVRPLLSKSGNHVRNAFEDIVKTSGRQPLHLRTDKGKEFQNKLVLDYFKKLGVFTSVTQNPDVKCAVVERVNRTLKTKMYKYFTHKNSWRYIDVLQDLVDGYNASFHRTIKMAPCDVNIDNMMDVFRNTHPPPSNVARKREGLLEVGSYVRINKEKRTFEKGYEENYTLEIFKINRIIHRKPLVYVLEDLNAKPIEGTFYRQELQPVNKLDTFKIDKILRTKGKAPSRQYYVAWKGYPRSFNSWVHERDIEKLA